MNRLDRKLTVLTVGLYLILLPLFSIIHEYGHAINCYTQGNTFEIHLSLFLNYVTCHGSGYDVSAYRMFGGFLSASVAFILFASLKSVLVRKLKFIAIVLVVIGTTQFFNMVMETYANDFYMNSSQIMTAVNTLMSMMMLFFLIQRHSSPTLDRVNDKKDKKEKEIPDNIFQRSIVDIIRRKKAKKILAQCVTDGNIPVKNFASLDLLEDLEGGLED